MLESHICTTPSEALADLFRRGWTPEANTGTGYAGSILVGNVIDEKSEYEPALQDERSPDENNDKITSHQGFYYQADSRSHC